MATSFVCIYIANGKIRTSLATLVEAQCAPNQFNTLANTTFGTKSTRNWIVVLIQRFHVHMYTSQDAARRRPNPGARR